MNPNTLILIVLALVVVALVVVALVTYRAYRGASRAFVAAQEHYSNVAELKEQYRRDRDAANVEITALRAEAGAADLVRNGLRRELARDLATFDTLARLENYGEVKQAVARRRAVLEGLVEEEGNGS